MKPEKKSVLFKLLESQKATKIWKQTRAKFRNPVRRTANLNVLVCKNCRLQRYDRKTMHKKQLFSIKFVIVEDNHAGQQKES